MDAHPALRERSDRIPRGRDEDARAERPSIAAGAVDHWVRPDGISPVGHVVDLSERHGYLVLRHARRLVARG